MNSAGDAVGDGGGYYVLDSNLTLTGGRVEANYASTGGNGRGGGLFLGGSTVLVTNTIIANNVAGGVGGFGRGGGVYSASTSARLIDNEFIGNRATRDEPWPGRGGAVEMSSSPGSQLQGNLFDGNAAPVYGGGIFLLDSDGVTLRSNRFTHNAALQGGAVYVLYGDGVAFEANTIVGNASSSGAGIYLYAGATRLDHNVVADNILTDDASAGAIQIEGNQARLRHNTIARNRNAAGIQVSGYFGGNGQAILLDSILAGNAVGISVTAGSLATFEDTLWGAGLWANGRNWGGDGAITPGARDYSGDPAFTDPENGDYHIGPGSAALDRGTYTGLEFDIDLQPRPYRRPDLGADEYWPRYVQTRPQITEGDGAR
jgi:hypothetical protein